jgi:DNA-binding transcriptional MerR regulator
MPNRDKDEDRIYYTIAEVADITRVPKYVIRFWESRFPEIKPDRKAGRRYFRQGDIDAIVRIRDLLYKHGFTIKGAKKAMKGRDDAAGERERELDLALAPKPGPAPEAKEDRRLLTRYSFQDGEAADSEREKSRDGMARVLRRLKAIKDILTA